MDHTLKNDPKLTRFVEALSQALGDRLSAVVLYGSAARGDYTRTVSDFNVLVVLADTEPGTLERLKAPFEAWRRERQPVPRIFGRATVGASADVFPIEYLEILQRHVVLHGSDPFEGMTVRPDYLRLQCERELREKLMRLTEAYVEAHDAEKDLRRLMVESYSVFAAIFRGCLRLLGGEPPVATHDVVSHFCARAGVDVDAFHEIERLRHGGAPTVPAKAAFARYYRELERAVDRVDAFLVQT
ncbi:MAG: nucleotidyltransferase domain-containing protein [Vicinamibacterales bacterium]